MVTEYSKKGLVPWGLQPIFRCHMLLLLCSHECVQQCILACFAPACTGTGAVASGNAAATLSAGHRTNNKVNACLELRSN